MKNYTNSDVFNSFIEIAEKKGLVSLAEEDESSKKALEKNPRADSLTKEKISKLYGLKPEAPKEMSYANNIMEVAHPKPAFIQDSYDKLNGLVENNIERQNAILKIVNKKTNGLLMQHKHAQDEMVRCLVRVANLLDNKGEGALAKLADECIESFVINKTATFNPSAEITVDLVKDVFATNIKPIIDAINKALINLRSLGKGSFFLLGLNASNTFTIEQLLGYYNRKILEENSKISSSTNKESFVPLLTTIDDMNKMLQGQVQIQKDNSIVKVLNDLLTNCKQMYQNMNYVFRGLRAPSATATSTVQTSSAPTSSEGSPVKNTPVTMPFKLTPAETNWVAKLEKATDIGQAQSLLIQREKYINTSATSDGKNLLTAPEKKEYIRRAKQIAGEYFKRFTTSPVTK